MATQTGGAELQLQQLIEHRQAAGLDPAVAFLATGPLISWCQDHGVPAYEIDAGRFRDFVAVARAVRRLVEIAAEQRSEVILSWLGKGQLYGGLAAAQTRIPSVWLQAGTGGWAPIDRVATILPARLVVTNSRGTDRAQRRLLPRRRTVVVYPAVDTSRFDPATLGDKGSIRRKLGLPDHVPIIGSVGRLNRWKGFHTLLDTVPGVLEHHPDAVFVVVGGVHDLDADYAEDLRVQAERVGRDGQVRLVGQQANPEEWMQAMDVFVHASANEPFGMVVIEAMALGKAVIASAEGGPTEVITPDRDGLLSPFGDSRALTTAILRLLGDEELRRRIGEAARRRAEGFGVHRFARELGAAVTRAAAPVR